MLSPSVHGSRGAIDEHLFASHAEASAALAGRVADDLAAAIDARGAATLAVPGGTTPGEFLADLGQQAVAWPRVTVLLTDERWVPPEHPRSNTALVQRTLARGGAPYRWFPLWRPGATVREAVAMLEDAGHEAKWPIDVAVLGMGDDGHVASLFPGGETDVRPGSSRFVEARGPDGEQRISLAAAQLASAQHVYLLLRGAAKLEVLHRALGGDLPVGRLAAARGGNIQVFASV